MQTAIKLCASHEIDPVKWNSCIAKSENGLIYSQYQYLSFLTKHWAAIIIGDYDAVLALPWNSLLSSHTFYSTIGIDWQHTQKSNSQFVRID
jgi:hypothetical protein